MKHDDPNLFDLDKPLPAPKAGDLWMLVEPDKESLDDAIVRLIKAYALATGEV